MADCAIILYLECLIGLIYHFKKLYSVFLVCLSSHFEKLGPSDLDKKDSYKKLKKMYLSLLLIHHQADFNEI